MNERAFERILLLSIQPDLASRILNGSKTVELRRVRPRITAGSIVLVYASTPVKALMGWFVVGQLLEADPAELWAKVQSSAGLTREQFDTYFTGSKRAFGITVQNAYAFSNPVTLDTLREIWNGFHPPQCYRYFSLKELNHGYPLLEVRAAALVSAREP